LEEDQLRNAQMRDPGSVGSRCENNGEEFPKATLRVFTL
jgi:hypothetical protein